MERRYYSFFWNKYCDWYIELSKIEKNEAVLVYVLDQYLKLLHPIMPHITEAIWQKMSIKKDSIGILNSVYPKYDEKLAFGIDSAKMETVFETIKALFKLEFKDSYDNNLDLKTNDINYSNNNDIFAITFNLNGKYNIVGIEKVDDELIYFSYKVSSSSNQLSK